LDFTSDFTAIVFPIWACLLGFGLLTSKLTINARKRKY